MEISLKTFSVIIGVVYILYMYTLLLLLFIHKAY